MIVIIWSIKDNPSTFCRLHRLKEARIIRMDDEMQEIETIRIAGQATEAAVSAEVLDDWRIVVEKAHDAPDTAESLFFVFPNTSQQKRFYYFKDICGAFEARQATHIVSLGELLKTGTGKYDTDKRIEETIDLLRNIGLKKLAAKGYVRACHVVRTSREGILGCSSYHYFGDILKRQYHLLTCEELEKVEDKHLVGLGKNPSTTAWKPCTRCIYEAGISSISTEEPVEERIQEKSQPKPKPNHKQKNTPTSNSVLGWEKRLEKVRGKTELTSGQIIQRAISSICDEYGMHAEFIGGTAFITTVAGEWFFTYNDRPIRLRHKNYSERAKDIGNTLDYYHLQKDRFPSPLHALSYIFKHDIELKRKIMWEADSELATDEYYFSGDDVMDVVSRAIIFAAKAHRGAVRKGTSIPYIVHPVETAAIAASMTDDREVIAAAVLHDVLEDTDVKASELQLEFGPRVRKLVEGESEDKRPGLPAAETWYVRKLETIDYLQSAATEEEWIITLADKLSNLRTCTCEYHIAGDAVWEKFNIKDKKMQGWYYKSIRDALGRLQDTDAWQEFNALVNNMFCDEE